MSGPLDDVLVVDLSRALAGPHGTMMLGDLGARVIKVEAPGTATTPAAGARRSSAPDASRSRRTSSPPTATRSRSPSTSRRRGRQDVLIRLVDRADVLRRELPHRRARAARPRHRAAARAQPAPGRPLDHRLRPRRARGRPRRLRPDRPGRGRPDVADRLRPRRPAAGRRADRRPAVRDVRRLRRLAALHERDRTGDGPVVRTSLLAVGRRRARLPGHPLDRGRRGRAAPGQPPPVDRPYGLFHCRDGAVQIALRQRGAVAEVLRRLRPRPRRPGPGHQPRAGRQPRRASSRSSRRPSPTGTPSCWPGWPRSASRPARCAPSTRSTSGTRRRPGPAGRRRAPDARPRQAARAAAAVLRRRRRTRSPARDHAAPAAARPARRRDPRLARRAGRRRPDGRA